MNTIVKNEKISTARIIANLGLPEQQRNRALAELALADSLAAAFVAATKLLHLR
jgi:hypothetical protein